MNTVHKLKCHPGPFLEIEEGHKTCEVRREDDRSFEVGDTLLLQEWRPDSGGYTGRELRALVTNVTKFAGNLRLVLRDTYGFVSCPAVVMSIAVRRDP